MVNKSDSSVKVYLRIRNTLNHLPRHLSIDNNTLSISNISPLITPSKAQIQSSNSQGLSNNQLNYTFDRIFDGKDTSEYIYHEAAQHLVTLFLKGQNVTLLTYGQTASGKTFTLGLEKGLERGVLVEAVKEVFDRLNDDRKVYSLGSNENKRSCLSLQFYEVYNDLIQDLLASPNQEMKVMVRQDKTGKILLENCTEVDVTTIEELIECLRKGIQNRATKATKKNHQSSRSHGIVKLILKQYHPNSHQLVESIWNFVDLAGSESIKKTEAKNLTLKEGIHINGGLLVLGNVISCLSNASTSGKMGYIPYRDSKLTRVLQDGLNRKTQIVMIACISDHPKDYYETINTLNYAQRAKKITLQLNSRTATPINLNPTYDQSYINQLKDTIQTLQAQLKAKEALLSDLSSLEYQQKRIQRLERELSHTKQKLILLQRDYTDLLSVKSKQLDGIDKDVIDHNSYKENLLNELEQSKELILAKDLLIESLKSRLQLLEAREKATQMIQLKKQWYHNKDGKDISDWDSAFGSNVNSWSNVSSTSLKWLGTTMNSNKGTPSLNSIRASPLNEELINESNSTSNSSALNGIESDQSSIESVIESALTTYPIIAKAHTHYSSQNQLLKYQKLLQLSTQVNLNQSNESPLQSNPPVPQSIEKIFNMDHLKSNSAPQQSNPAITETQPLTPPTSTTNSSPYTNISSLPKSPLSPNTLTKLTSLLSPSVPREIDLAEKELDQFHIVIPDGSIDRYIRSNKFSSLPAKLRTG